jgi:hypothetical protein
MQQRTWLIIFIIFAIIGLFLLSPRGKTFREKYLSGAVATVGSFLKGITARAVSTKPSKPTQKIEIGLSGVNIANMNGQEFSVEGSTLEGSFIVESASLEGGSLSFKGDEVVISVNDMSGTISYHDGKMKVTGKTNQIWFDDIGFNKTDISFTFEGKPSQYTLSNIQKDVISFSQISGSLSWTGLRVPPLLSGDKLELYNFEGDIKQKNGLVGIIGTVNYMKLNNVPIGPSA